MRLTKGSARTTWGTYSAVQEGDWTFRSQDHSLPGAKVPAMELSLPLANKSVEEKGRVRGWLKEKGTSLYSYQ